MSDGYAGVSDGQPDLFDPTANLFVEHSDPPV
jgi:hypothetical protein